MNESELKNNLSTEIQAIMSPTFNIAIADTPTVPSLDDSQVTYPNLTTNEQRCKRIETCVLYVDIRSSTELSFAHRKSTLARLYCAFVRAMAQCASFYGGKVRNIVGDRMMVAFDAANSEANAVRTAILMNTVIQYVLNPNFTPAEFRCGIGIDHGAMLITKAGIVKQGSENTEYKSLVWLGRPANVASKLTDEANKPNGIVRVPRATASQRTKPILMTKAVLDGYLRWLSQTTLARGEWVGVRKLWQPCAIKVAGYTGTIYGGDVVLREFQTPRSVPKTYPRPGLR